MNKQIKKAKEIKAEEVKNLTEKIAKSKSFAFVDYHGLTATAINQLRDKVRSVGGELHITKNTLLKKALISDQSPVTSDQLPATSDQLTGPTAAIFAYKDEIAPIKEAAETAKVAGTPKFKFGFFGKDLLDSSALESLSKIPGRNILHAKLVDALSSPIYGTLSVLQANLRNLVYILDQKAKISS